MTAFPTKTNETRLYNLKGKVHGASPLRTLRVDVTGNPVSLGEGRGQAFRLVSPDNAYVLIADLRTSATPPDIELPPMEPPQIAGMYAIKGDHEQLKYEYQSRTLGVDWTGLRQTPAVYRFEKTARIPISDYRVDVTALNLAIRNLNDHHPNKIARLYSPGTALFNNQGYPKQQYLVMSHNVLKPLAIEGKYLKFETLKPTSNVSGMSYQTHPQFVHRWTLVTAENGVTKYVRDRYGDIFWFLCSNEGYGYIPLDWVKLL